MEVSAEKDVCCCGPKIWVRFVGGLQLFGTLLVGIFATPLIFTAISQTTEGETDEVIQLANKITVAAIWVGVGLSILVVALFLFGNEKGRTGFLWPWLVSQWTGTVSAGLGAIMALFTLQMPICLLMVVRAIVGGLLLYVVHQRRKEIIAMKAQTTVGVYAQM